MARAFFQASRDALESITTLYDFVHPLRASLNYTRHTVEMMHEANPDITQSEIQAVIDPQQVIHGANFISAFFDTEEKEHEQLLAWILLNSLLAIHEGWCAQIMNLFEDARMKSPGISNGSPDTGVESEKCLQYEGLWRKISPEANKAIQLSAPLKESFYTKYKDALDFSPSLLDNYMRCYRYFKEARNCYMHANKIADDRVVAAFTSYNGVANPSDLEMKESPIALQPTKGKPVVLSLRGVIGFSDAVRRIIMVCDSCLLAHKEAECELDEARNKLKKPTETLSQNRETAKEQVGSVSRSMGFISPNWSQKYQDLLVEKKILAK